MVVGRGRDKGHNGLDLHILLLLHNLQYVEDPH